MKYQILLVITCISYLVAVLLLLTACAEPAPIRDGAEVPTPIQFVDMLKRERAHDAGLSH